MKKSAPQNGFPHVSDAEGMQHSNGIKLHFNVFKSECSNHRSVCSYKTPLRCRVFIVDRGGKDGDVGASVDQKNTARLLIKDGLCSEAAGGHSGHGGSAGSYWPPADPFPESLGGRGVVLITLRIEQLSGLSQRKASWP